jgi:hypothetical protein
VLVPSSSQDSLSPAAGPISVTHVPQSQKDLPRNVFIDNEAILSGEEESTDEVEGEDRNEYDLDDSMIDDGTGSDSDSSSEEEEGVDHMDCQ